MRIIIFRNEVLLAQSCFEFRRVNIAVLTGCVWDNFALNFDECTSQFLQEAFRTSNNEELIYCLSLVLNFDECPSQILLDVFGTKLLYFGMKWCSGDTLPPATTITLDLWPTLTVTGSVFYCLSLVLNFDECPSQILLDVFGTSNNEELIYCLSLVLNFDECPSQILLDVFGTKLLYFGMKWCSGDTLPPATTIKLDLCPTLTVTGSVLF
ncbi:hypothetical protein V1477_001041 [Vespula maculifrons]|uniref:Uncharacterized protein n=1 Tax=Vespula maculifrons TaxID=7453 RepID=A0ABD2D0M9_VESMC